MNQITPEPKNPAEALATKPVRASIAIVAIALMCSLTLNGVVTSVYSLKDKYANIISDQELQLAAVSAAKKRPIVEAPVVEKRAPKATNRIIVKFKDEANAPKGLAIAAERANLEKAQGLRKLLSIKALNADVYEVAEEDDAQEVIDRILSAKRDLVEYAEVDMLVPPTYTPNDPNLGSAWHINKVSAPLAWDTARGEGVIIAIADSGVDCTHPDLAASCVPGWNTASNNADTSDINNHGTWVAGTAAQIGDNAVGSAGIAYKAKIMPMRVTDSPDGYAYFSAIANAFIWAADNGAKVAQASYSGCGSASIISAASYMRSKGGVATVSAGNTGADGLFAPSADLVCVSATDSNDARTSWSSFGQYVDVAAPGAGIYTTARGGGYASVNGTSFSGPLTTGIYALMFSANPSLTPAQADNILFTTADDLGTPGWDMYYGHGRVNAAKAVAAAITASGTRDTVAPSVPQNLRTTSITSNSISLTWDASTDASGVKGYSVYRNGTKLATVTATAYTNTGLTPNTSYAYTIRAEDSAGNVSGDSPALTVSTGDITFGISSYSVSSKTATSATISVALNKPGSVIVRYGTTAANLNGAASSTASVPSHAVRLSNLTPFTTYYYQVTAIDAAGAVINGPISSFKTTRTGGKPRR